MGSEKITAYSSRGDLFVDHLHLIYGTVQTVHLDQSEMQLESFLQGEAFTAVFKITDIGTQCFGFHIGDGVINVLNHKILLRLSGAAAITIVIAVCGILGVAIFQNLCILLGAAIENDVFYDCTVLLGLNFVEISFHIVL